MVDCDQSKIAYKDKEGASCPGNDREMLWLNKVAGGDSMILITGAAGFIGFHLSLALLKAGLRVVGVDNLNDYYDPNLKVRRISALTNFEEFVFERFDITDERSLFEIFERHKPEYVVHLAAQAGIRYSFTNPRAYLDSNLIGFFNVLEACRSYKPKHFVFASSSSVYGNSSIIPFTTLECADKPVSLYAATKRSNELMAYVYSYNFEIPTTGLRFFTVYGPWGRPDMAYFKFTKNMLEDMEIEVYANGELARDFTYIDDVVESLLKVVFKIPDKCANGAPYKVYNVGSGKPATVNEMIAILEKLLNKKAKKVFKEMQPGDVRQTFADVSDFEKDFGFRPRTDLETGLRKFVEWYLEYYEIRGIRA